MKNHVTCGLYYKSFMIVIHGRNDNHYYKTKLRSYGLKGCLHYGVNHSKLAYFKKQNKNLFFETGPLRAIIAIV